MSEIITYTDNKFNSRIDRIMNCIYYEQEMPSDVNPAEVVAAKVLIAASERDKAERAELADEDSYESVMLGCDDHDEYLNYGVGSFRGDREDFHSDG